MGINAELWGSQAWHFIHSVAITFPANPTETDKENYLQFFKSLENVLPCPFCAEHYKENMAKIPPRFDNSKELFEWSVDMHNEVNKANNKPVLTYEEAYNEFEHNLNIDKYINRQNAEVKLLYNRLKNLKKWQM